MGNQAEMPAVVFTGPEGIMPWATGHLFSLEPREVDYTGPAPWADLPEEPIKVEKRNACS